MKNSIVVLLVILIQNFLFGITEYKPNDELYVWAKSGLNLRENPNSDAQVLIKIPFGEKVISQDYKNYYEYEYRSIRIVQEVGGYEIKSAQDMILIKGK